MCNDLSVRSMTKLLTHPGKDALLQEPKWVVCMVSRRASYQKARGQSELKSVARFLEKAMTSQPMDRSATQPLSSACNVGNPHFWPSLCDTMPLHRWGSAAA